jgi:hypothetical protein
MSRATKYYYDYGTVGSWGYHQVLAYFFRSWFSAKSAPYGIREGIFVLNFSIVTFETIMDVIKPTNLILSITFFNSHIGELISRFECKTGFLFNLSNYLVDKILCDGLYGVDYYGLSKQIFDEFQSLSDYITVVPCLEEIASFSNNIFPNANMILVYGSKGVGPNFLKCNLVNSFTL